MMRIIVVSKTVQNDVKGQPLEPFLPSFRSTVLSAAP